MMDSDDEVDVGDGLHMPVDEMVEGIMAAAAGGAAPLVNVADYDLGDFGDGDGEDDGEDDGWAEIRALLSSKNKRRPGYGGGDIPCPSLARVSLRRWEG